MISAVVTELLFIIKLARCLDHQRNISCTSLLQNLYCCENIRDVACELLIVGLDLLPCLPASERLVCSVHECRELDGDSNFTQKTRTVASIHGEKLHGVTLGCTAVGIPVGKIPLGGGLKGTGDGKELTAGVVVDLPNNILQDFQ